MSGDKHTYFFDWSNAAHYHNIMAAGYFIVPFDGVYTFHVSADDRAELRYDFDDKGKGSTEKIQKFTFDISWSRTSGEP